MGYVNSLIYVVMNTVISRHRGAAGGLCLLALHASWATSTCSSGCSPTAWRRRPSSRCRSSSSTRRSGLFDTHIAVALAHCLFNVPLAVWILEGFMRGVPREIDETAYIDGYSLPALLRAHLHAADRERHRRRRLLLLHVLLGRAAAVAHADLGRRQAHRRHHDPHRLGLGPRLGRAGGGGGADDRARARS